MQVIARINESRIDKVKVGMRAKIRLDAFANSELTGVVRTVSEYPLPALSVYSTTKEYGAEVYIDETPTGVRCGMTAQVAIEVQRKGKRAPSSYSGRSLTRQTLLLPRRQ